jgi:hypothetical protein
MKHLIWMSHDLLLSFDRFMNFFFVPLALSNIASVAAIAWFLRDKKPLVFTVVVVLVLCGAFLASDWVDLQLWRLYPSS